MRYALLIALLLVAAVQIDTVYYDAHNEAGSEFIVLANDGDTDIDVTGWTVATPSSETDATLTGTIRAGKQMIVADAGWNDSKDDESWPEADIIETLTLPNTNGFVQIIDAEQEVIDTLGWGETERYLGTTHPGADEGQALIRVSSTGNNEQDFVAQDPEFSESQNTDHGTPITIIVEDSPPELLGYEFMDESPDSQQLDVMPVPGEDVYINVSVEIEDLNTLENITVSANDIMLTTTDTGTRGTYTGSVPITTQTDEVVIRFSDANHTQSIRVPVHLLSVAGLYVPSGITLSTAPGNSTNVTIPLRNTGTQPLDIHVRATLPSWSAQVVGSIEYLLAGERYELSNTYTVHEIGLEPGEELDMVLQVRAGYVPAREYLGELVIAGVPS